MTRVEIFAAARAWMSPGACVTPTSLTSFFAKTLLDICDADARLAIESDAVVTVEGAVDDLAGSASLYIDPLCGDPDHAGTGRPCGFSVSPREARVLAARLLRAAEKAEGDA